MPSGADVVPSGIDVVLSGVVDLYACSIWHKPKGSSLLKMLLGVGVSVAPKIKVSKKHKLK